jgi:membrane protein required for beta-lactamase induction
MTLILLLLAFAIDKYFQAATKVNMDLDGYIFHWYDWLKSSFGEKDWFKPWLEFLITMLVPLLIVGSLLSADGGFILWLIQVFLSLVIILWCFETINQETKFTDYYLAMQREDFEAAYLHAKQASALPDDLEIDNCGELAREVSKQMLSNANHQFFAIVIYLLLLGPMGSLLYFMSYQLRSYSQNPIFNQFFDALDWLPSRITIISYSLAGDFAGVMSRVPLGQYFSFEQNELLMQKAGLGALGLSVNDACEDGLAENKQAMDLLARARVVVLALVALMTLIGWLN